ncbi:hypothetical protein LINPERPRIM_LOCUS6367 [Linum perenne]
MDILRKHKARCLLGSHCEWFRHPS